MPEHRNPRRRKTAQTLSTAFRAPIAAGILLSENPNAGKRKAMHAPAKYRLTESGDPVQLRTIPRTI